MYKFFPVILFISIYFSVYSLNTALGRVLFSEEIPIDGAIVQHENSQISFSINVSANLIIFIVLVKNQILLCL